jgi:hyperosmotically inducible protein
MAALAVTMSLAAACSPGEQREVREEVATAGAEAEARIEDGAVTAAVKTKLLADQMVSGMRIDVDTHDGVVVLSGTVDDARARARANELAQTTQGVLRVEDKLAIAR